jgi:hypothetical protein
VTGVAYRQSFIPFVGYVGDSVLTGHAATGTGRPSGAPPDTLAGRISRFAVPLAQDSAGADVAGRSGLAAPVRPASRRWTRRACGSWRLDGR